MIFKKHAGPNAHSRNTTLAIFLTFFLLFTLLMSAGIAMALNLPTGQLTRSEADEMLMPEEQEFGYHDLMSQLQKLEESQNDAKIHLLTKNDINTFKALISFNIASGNKRQLSQDLADLQQKIAQSQKQLKFATGNLDHPKILPHDGSTITASSNNYQLPIILYHLTPADFENQLIYLETHGYTTITLIDLVTAKNGGTALPAKPVIITFDDGFTDQLKAFEILKRHNMKATFYIINGGGGSGWCIGAGRRYNDPAQPPGGCGDSYLTWDQVRMLDKSGLITIGAHTVNHANLASLSAEQQSFEIQTSKTGIEAQLGHAITDFCYPYGAFNATSIAIVKAAGFTNATTTISGTAQPDGNFYTLRRIRSTLNLP